MNLPSEKVLDCFGRAADQGAASSRIMSAAFSATMMVGA
jgi:hypothetical protein